MLTLRFFQALGGGFSTVICLATVRDVYPVEQLGRRFATVTMVLLIAPLVAPALGAAVLPLGWEMIFVLKAVYAGVLLAALRLGRAGDAAGPPEQPVAALRVPPVLRRRAAARRRASLADSLRDGHGVLGVVHDDLRHQLVVHLHGVLRRRAGAFLVLFALSVLGFMSMNLFSMWRLKSDNAGTFFRVGLTVQVVIVAGLLAVVASGQPCFRRWCRSSCSPCRRSASSARRVLRGTWGSSASSPAAPRRSTRR